MDKSCKLATLLRGQIKVSHILVDRFNGKDPGCDIQIIRFAYAKCNIFLKSKFISLR
jgi:hypothetical protein